MSERLHPIRLGDLIDRLVESNHGSLSMALALLAKHLSETIILIPESWDIGVPLEAPTFEKRFELPMTEIPGQGGKGVDGPALRAGLEDYVRNAGRFPDVLISRSIAEGCMLRATLLSAAGHPAELANLRVDVNPEVQAGTFYLLIDQEG